MKTAQAHNSQLTGAIDIVEITREKLILFGINPPKNFVPGAFMHIRRMPVIDPVRHPNYWQAVNYKRVLDPESGFHVYPWEITPTWRGIKKVGRGNVSAEAI